MNEKILVVDDEKNLRDLIASVLQMKDYEIALAEDGEAALKLFETFEPDLIISDIRMPNMNGFDFLETVRARESGAAVPFLFLSAYSQKSNFSQARRLAVDDYLTKPFDALELLDAVRVRLDRRRAVQIFDTHEAHLQTILLMANLVEARDSYTYDHIQRVRDIALLFGKELQWGYPSLTFLEFGAILHDIGKLTVPKNVLTKQAPFSEEEWEIMRQHPEAGANMLKDVHHLQPAVPFILYHHEKWDGTGYPFGLSGENIPLEGRVMAIVDVYDAITSERPYHQARTHAEALEMLQEKSGTHFDPYLVEKFLNLDLPQLNDE